MSLFNPDEKKEVNEKLRNLAESLYNRERRKTGVESNGLCLVLAYVIKSIQLEFIK